MVKAVLPNGAGKYYTIFFLMLQPFVSNSVTAAMKSDSNNDIIRFVLNYDLVATEVPNFNPLAARSKFPHLHIST